MVVRFPARAQDITPGLLTELISAQYLGVVVEDVAVTDEWTYGLGQVSAAARLGLTVRYGGDPGGLPERLIVKIDRRNNSPPGSPLKRSCAGQRPAARVGAAGPNPGLTCGFCGVGRRSTPAKWRAQRADIPPDGAAGGAGRSDGG